MIKNNIIHKYLSVILSFFIGNGMILGAMVYVSHDLESRLKSIAGQTFTVVRFLEEIRFTGIRITGTAHEILLFSHIDMPNRTAETYSSEEKDEVDEIEVSFTELKNNLNKYSQYIEIHYPDEKTTYEKIALISKVLIMKTKNFLQEEKDQENSNVFLKNKEQYELIEEQFITVLNDAIEYERLELDERVEGLHKTLALSNFIILICFIILLIIVLISGFSISRNIVYRLRKLQTITHSISQDGLSISADEDGTDEVSALAKSFNVMTQRLKAMVGAQQEAKIELEKLNATLENQVKDRTSELYLALEQANEANQVKTDFLSAMSHELRTPLNAIIGFSQLLINSQKDPLNGKQKLQAQHIYHAGDQLLLLINDVLDYAEMEVNETELYFEHIYPNDLIKECFELMQPIADKRNISLCSKKETGYGINVDRMRLKQICLNFLSNAIKYNVDNGTVIFGCSDQPHDFVRIYVTDTGKGISNDNLESIFMPFNRIGMENSSIEGTGIGLTITKKLVEQMRGEIGCESEKGKGSTFWVDFPRHKYIQEP